MHSGKIVKVLAFGYILFFSALGAFALGRPDASRGNVPRLEVSTIDQRSRLIRFDWSRVDYPEEYRYGLYRLDRSTRTNVFIKELVKTDTQFADTGLQPPLYNYFYVVECVSKDDVIQERKDIRAPSDREIAQQTASAYYIDTRNPQYWIDEDTPSVSERGVPDTTPRPPPGRRTTTAQSPNEGIYVGLIGFSGKVREITKDPVLIPLDPAGRQELMDKLNVAYTQSHDFGSAPYYAVHSALANMSELQRTGGLPRNIEYVTMITFTDGLDTSSTDSSFTPLEGKDFRPGSGNTLDDYKDYIVRELKSRTIGGVRINAFTIGVEGRNRKNNWTFNQLLREMSTDDTHYAKLADLGQLGSSLSTIADVLNLYTSIVNVTFTTPSYPVGTTVRLTFDNDVKDPNKSKYWIEGDVDWVNGKYILTNLCSNGVRLGSTQNVLGLRTPRGIEYTIRLNDDFYPENLRQWQLPPAEQNLPVNWVLIHDFYSEKSLDVIRGRKSSIVYLVLDCNPSLKIEEINSIRGAVQSFIDKLYESATSGIKLAPLGGVPKAEIAKVNTVKRASPSAAEKPLSAAENPLSAAEKPLSAAAEEGQVYAPAPRPRVKPAEKQDPPLPAGGQPGGSPAAAWPDSGGGYSVPNRPLVENNINILNSAGTGSQSAAPPASNAAPLSAAPSAENGMSRSTVNVYVPPAPPANTPSRVTVTSSIAAMPLPVLPAGGIPAPAPAAAAGNAPGAAAFGTSSAAAWDTSSAAAWDTSGAAAFGTGAAAWDTSGAAFDTGAAGFGTGAAGFGTGTAVVNTSGVTTSVTVSGGEILRGPLKTPNYGNPPKGFWIQLGAYQDLIRAQRAAAPILAGGFVNLEIFAKEVNGSLFYRLKMGPYRSFAEADGALLRLGQSSLPVTEGFIVRE